MDYFPQVTAATYLLFLAVLALDAVVHAHLAHELLSQEVTDLDEGAAL